jgi:hypothetical protein
MAEPSAMVITIMPPTVPRPKTNKVSHCPARIVNSREYQESNRRRTRESVDDSYQDRSAHW